jgi:hypothetical protein
MTKLELALILNIIDKHTIPYSPNYCPEDKIIREIKDAEALKEDIVRHYEGVMKDANT